MDEALENCLECINNPNATIEDCVAGYPEQQGELVELLELAQAIRRIEQVSPRAEFVGNAAQRLAPKLADRNVSNKEQTRPVKRKRQSKLKARRRFSLARFAVVLVLVMAALTGGSALAANNAVPGDFLYDADLTLEQVLLNMAPSDEIAARIHLKIADERLAEAEKVLAFSDVRNSDAALEAYENEIAAIAQLVGSKSGADQEKLARLLETALTKHITVLRNLLEKVPEQARYGIQNALFASSKAKDNKGKGPPIDKPQGPSEDVTTGKPKNNNKNNKNKDKDTGKPDFVKKPPGKP
jgi:hypothetical protein